ncbi:hypothetical protein A6A40_10705 [Azospirillum humicireducens]|uniref:Uncharacterized protein n=1 Tax=Azospirillum humicireducens TaxID=1226968 RepID=A0A160JHP3_9PROT|nr:hypothetical protein [Azospirillum humicireducens]ANC92334.1 hypothetical protein A6A40_10705 [Azospirillum humicireducens]
MMAERRAKSRIEGWSNHDAAGSMSGEVTDEAASCTDADAAVGQPACRPAAWQDREGRLVEALLECTTIAGLFALLFGLFVLFGAAHTLAP